MLSPIAAQNVTDALRETIAASGGVANLEERTDTENAQGERLPAWNQIQAGVGYFPDSDERVIARVVGVIGDAVTDRFFVLPLAVELKPKQHRFKLGIEIYEVRHVKTYLSHLEVFVERMA